MSDIIKTFLRRHSPWRRWALGLGMLGLIGSGCGSESAKPANPAMQATSPLDPKGPPVVPIAGPVVSPVVPNAVPPAPPPAAAPARSSTNELAMVLGSAVNVRPSAGTTGAPVGRIHCGDLVAVRGREGDWLQIQLKELSGYAHSAYLVEVKAGQGTRPTCEFGHRGITAPRNKKPEKLPSVPGASPQVALTKIAADKAVPEQVAVAAATLPAAPVPPAAPATTPTPAPTVAPAKPSAAASAGGQPQLVWLSAHGIKPKVLFPHPHHAQMFACAKCHHPLGSAGPNKDKDCHSCHIAGGKGQSPVSNKDAFHQTCRACHEATGRGPTACQDCHNGGK